MKTLKYLSMGVLMLGFSLTATAQDGTKADVDAVKKIISAKPADLTKQLKPFYNKNKKNAENLVAFARAFYDVKDYENAKLYANYALTASKNKCAPAFILLGDIEALDENGGNAAAMYDQAIYADPKNPDAYYKYALVYRKISPSQSADKLRQMKENCPDVEVDAIIGHIYMLARDEKTAYESFKKVDINKMDKGNLNEFARASYFTGHFDDALKASEAGMRLVPRNPTFTRLAMFSNYELKNYDAAKGLIHKYFHETDSAKFSEYDHFYAAKIYEALNEQDNAFKSYEQALELVNDSSMIKRWDILRTLSDAYKAKGDFDNAIKTYKEFLSTNKAAKFKDYEGLATLYSKQADALESASAKEAALMNADAAYADLGNRFAENKEYVLYRRASLYNKLDPDQKKGLAKPYYEQLINLLSSKSDKDSSDKQILITSYHYMMAYSYFTGKDLPKAKEYANKILEINPDYKPAQDILNLK